MEAERLAAAADASTAVIDNATGAAVPLALTRARRDGWTQQRQRAFGRALADTGSYGKAAARVGISMTSVQRLRRRSPEFQALCDKALVEGGITVEEAAYVRAVEGWEEPIVSGGKVIGYRRRFSDTLTRALLVTNGGSPASAKKAPAQMSSEEVDRALMERFEKLSQALKRQEREEQIAWAEDMARRGWAP